MDFAKPLECEPSVASRSNIRYICPAKNNKSSDNNTLSEGEKKSKALDAMLLEEANAAAIDLLLGDGEKSSASTTLKKKDDDENGGDQVKEERQEKERGERLLEQQVNAALFPDRCKSSSSNGKNNKEQTIQEGDLVVILISFDNLSFLYAKKDEIFSNRNGHFHHNDFLGKPYGCKIRSRNNRGYGFCYLLKPTPELWARSLNHRTQIVHELDQSQILFQLYLRPNAVVVESGTGSGAMSHAILRSIAPRGHLHTYEFNQLRAETARKEFEQHGLLENLVTVHHADVCGKKPVVAVAVEPARTSNGGANGGATTATETATAVHNNGGGFGLPGQSVDAVFLDLPEPWLAVPHAAYVLKSGVGRIASYSPCVEQTQRTLEALNRAGFHSCKTMEFRLQEHYVDEVEYESPPCTKRQRMEPHPQQALFQQQQQKQGTSATQNGSSSGAAVAATTKDLSVNGDDDVAVATSDATTAAEAMQTQKEDTEESRKTKKKAMLVARPYSMMRGHTAFLTFATAGIIPQPNPAAVKETTAVAVAVAAAAAAAAAAAQSITGGN